MPRKSRQLREVSPSRETHPSCRAARLGRSQRLRAGDHRDPNSVGVTPRGDSPGAYGVSQAPHRLNGGATPANPCVWVVRRREGRGEDIALGMDIEKLPPSRPTVHCVCMEHENQEEAVESKQAGETSRGNQSGIWALAGTFRANEPALS